MRDDVKQIEPEWDGNDYLRVYRAVWRTTTQALMGTLTDYSKAQHSNLSMGQFRGLEPHQVRAAQDAIVDFVARVGEAVELGGYQADAN